MRRLFLVFFVASLLAACGASEPAKPYEFKGMTSSESKPAPEIALPDQNGNLFRLTEQGGKVVLIYFGYTHCPDLCPTTLNDFKTIKQQLGKDADRVRFVFVTVDPARDTPEVVKQYIEIFDPTFVGLSPNAEQLAALLKSYDLKLELAAPGEDGSYAVAHTSVTYVIDRSSQVRVLYPTGSGFPAKFIAEDVAYLLSNK